MLRWFRERGCVHCLARDAGISQATGYRYLHVPVRRPEYILNLDQPLRHPAEACLTVRALVDLGLAGVSQPPNTASASVTVAKTRRT